MRISFRQIIFLMQFKLHHVAIFQLPSANYEDWCFEASSILSECLAKTIWHIEKINGKSAYYKLHANIRVKKYTLSKANVSATLFLIFNIGVSRRRPLDLGFARVYINQNSRGVSRGENERKRSMHRPVRDPGAIETRRREFPSRCESRAKFSRLATAGLNWQLHFARRRRSFRSFLAPRSHRVVSKSAVSPPPVAREGFVRF